MTILRMLLADLCHNIFADHSLKIIDLELLLQLRSLSLTY